MSIYAIMTFHSTHFALKAKKVLEKTGKMVETLPVPREFSSECGFCCKVSWEEREEIERILKEQRVEIDHIYRWEKDEEKEKKRKFRFV